MLGSIKVAANSSFLETHSTLVKYAKRITLDWILSRGITKSLVTAVRIGRSLLMIKQLPQVDTLCLYQIRVVLVDGYVLEQIYYSHTIVSQ